MNRAAYQRIAYAIMMGLLGAAIVHIIIILLLPEISARNAWSRMSATVDAYRPVLLSSLPGEGAHDANRDPLFRSAACRFDLGDGTLHVRAAGAVPYWSASIHDQTGTALYSFNDRSARDRELDFVVLTPAQMLEIRKNVPEELAHSIFVESRAQYGIAVIRAFIPDESWIPAVEAFLDSLSCQPQ